MGISLNQTLARWVDDAPLNQVDCGACARFGKCCDFQPFVPGFLLGATLAAGGDLPPPSPAYALQPIGLVPSRSFRAARDARGDQTPLLADLCAFYKDGACAIWAWRPGECSAYSCAGGGGDVASEAFALETLLSQMALLEQGYAAAEVERQIDILNEPGDQLANVDGIEVTYRRAWDWARGLSRADIDAWLEDV